MANLREIQGGGMPSAPLGAAPQGGGGGLAGLPGLEGLSEEQLMMLLQMLMEQQGGGGAPEGPEEDLSGLA